MNLSNALTKAITVTVILTSSLSASAVSRNSHARNSSDHNAVREHRFNRLSPFVSASVGVADLKHAVDGNSHKELAGRLNASIGFKYKYFGLAASGAISAAKYDTLATKSKLMYAPLTLDAIFMLPVSTSVTLDLILGAGVAYREIENSFAGLRNKYKDNVGVIKLAAESTYYINRNISIGLNVGTTFSPNKSIKHVPNTALRSSLNASLGLKFHL